MQTIKTDTLRPMGAQDVFSSTPCELLERIIGLLDKKSKFSIFCTNRFLNDRVISHVRNEESVQAGNLIEVFASCLNLQPDPKLTVFCESLAKSQCLLQIKQNVTEINRLLVLQLLNAKKNERTELENICVGLSSSWCNFKEIAVITDLLTAQKAACEWDFDTDSQFKNLKKLSIKLCEHKLFDEAIAVCNAMPDIFPILVKSKAIIRVCCLLPTTRFFNEAVDLAKKAVDLVKTIPKRQEREQALMDILQDMCSGGFFSEATDILLQIRNKTRLTQALQKVVKFLCDNGNFEIARGLADIYCSTVNIDVRSCIDRPSNSA